MKEKLVILGAGESGTGAAILAASVGYNVFVSDNSAISQKYKEKLQNNNICYEENSHSYSKILDAAKVIKSPGIPDNVEVITKIKEANIPICSEIEFAAENCKVPIIGITGSNGKTTTTMLIHYILTNEGLNAGLAGNVGKSFAEMIATENHDLYVIELSSFQLDDIINFNPSISILLNITPDHLDRYNYSFDNYIKSKFRIALNHNSENILIYNADDYSITSNLTKYVKKSQLIPFSIEKELDYGGCVKDNNLNINILNNKFIMSINDLALQGKHNQYNSLAAGIAANVLRIRKDVIRESLINFQSVEHRMEKVIKVHGIEFINDSKATNVNSTWYALESMNKPIIWIVGGVDKGNDYSQLSELVKDKVKGIVYLGVENSKLKESFSFFNGPQSEAVTMKDAVKMAYKMAYKGDVVLLSPACASFDLFDNYEDRGVQFKKAIRDL